MISLLQVDFQIVSSKLLQQAVKLTPFDKPVGCAHCQIFFIIFILIAQTWLEKDVMFQTFTLVLMPALGTNSLSFANAKARSKFGVPWVDVTVFRKSENSS